MKKMAAEERTINHEQRTLMNRNTAFGIPDQVSTQSSGLLSTTLSKAVSQERIDDEDEDDWNTTSSTTATTTNDDEKIAVKKMESDDNGP